MDGSTIIILAALLLLGPMLLFGLSEYMMGRLSSEEIKGRRPLGLADEDDEDDV
jgi:hypothetical protein